MKNHLMTFVLLFLLSLTSMLMAATASPWLTSFKQEDGTKLEFYLKGDEKVSWGETPDGYSLLYNEGGSYEYAVLDEYDDMVPSGIMASNKSTRRADELELLAKLQPQLRFSKSQIDMLIQIWDVYDTESRAFPTTGNRKLLAILVGFADTPITRTQLDFQNLFNQIGYSHNGSTGSVKDFYLENSYGQLNLTTDVAGPYQLANSISYYGTDARLVLRQAINLADADVDFSDYDNDNDGMVDGVYMLYAGYPGPLGAHAWNLGVPVFKDGVYVYDYSCSAELQRVDWPGQITTIGVICHEFGHTLGAEDFYDTDYDTGGQYYGTGPWDLMGSGNWNNDGKTPAHHNGLTKTVYYQWAPLQPLDAGTSVTLENAAQNSSSFYRYDTTTPNEYFLIENRQKVGFDAALPGEGMLIYHVHAAYPQAGNGINATHPQKMYPVSQNASMDPNATPSSYGSIYDANCAWNGTQKTAFSDFTLPSSKSWAGAFTHRPITNITRNIANKTVSFDFLGDAPSFAIDRTWLGAISSDWHSPANWSGNSVPNQSQNVAIYGNVTRYPSITQDAFCKNLFLSTRAELMISSAGLYVQEDIIDYGRIIMIAASSVLVAGRDITWQALSNLTIQNDGAQIRCKRGMTFEVDSSLQIARGTVIFYSGGFIPAVDYDSYIINKSADTQLNKVSSLKASPYKLEISSLSTRPFTINGNLECSPSSGINSAFIGLVTLKGDLICGNTSAAGITWNSGTLKMNGANQSISIPHAAGFLNHLVVANTGNLSLPNNLWVKGTLQVYPNGQITVGDKHLVVDGTVSFAGELIMTSALGNFSVQGDLNWQNHASASITDDNAKIFCKGSMEFSSGSAFAVDRGYLEFYGPTSSIIVNHSAYTAFYNLRISKTEGATLSLSSVSTHDLLVSGNIQNYPNSTFHNYYTGTVYLQGSLISQNTTTSGIQWNVGTLQITGSQSAKVISLPHAGDYLNNLDLQRTSGTTLSSNLTVKGNINVASGAFNAGNNTLKIGGNWMVHDSATFNKDSSTVVFNGTGPQTVASTWFNILRLDKSADKLLINSAVYVDSYQYANGTIEIANTILTLFDLAADGIYGHFILQSGSLDITQDAAQSVDLNGWLEIYGGFASITGGNGDSYWAYAADARLDMSGGVLDFNTGIRILDDDDFSFVSNITGGTLKTSGSFLCYRTDFQPGGGILEMYGSSDAVLHFSNNQSYLHGLKINKGRSGTQLALNEASSHQGNSSLSRKNLVRRDESSTATDYAALRANSVRMNSNIYAFGDINLVSGTLILDGHTLSTESNMHVSGIVNMTNEDDKLVVYASLYWDAGAFADIEWGDIDIYNNLYIAANSSFVLGDESHLNFQGAGANNLINLSNNCSIASFDVLKVNGSVHTQNSLPFVIRYNLGVAGGSTFSANSPISTGLISVTNAGTLLITANMTVNGNIMINGNATVDNCTLLGHSGLIFNSGQFALNNATFLVDRPYAGVYMHIGGALSLTNSTFNVLSNGINFATGSSFSSNGGTLKVGWNLTANTPNTFQPAGGKVQMTGTNTAMIQCHASNYFYDLFISKTSVGGTVSTADPLTINGELCLAGGVFMPASTLNIYGSLSATELGTINASGAAVSMRGSSAAILEAYSPLTIPTFTINKTGTGYVGLAQDLILSGTTQMNIVAGEFRLIDYSCTMGGTINVTAGGKLVLTSAAILDLADQSSLVFSGSSNSLRGSLVVDCDPGHTALITSSTGYYGIRFNAYGELKANRCIFEKLNTAGLYLASGSIVADAYSFNDCTFRNGQAGGTLLQKHSIQIVTVNNVVFPTNTWGGAYNVHHDNAAGKITFVNASGSFAGAAFENDPYNRVFWESSGSDIPQNVQISWQGGRPRLSWDIVPGTINYYIYRSQDPYAANWGASVASTSGLVWIDSSALTGIKYFYRVTASH